MRKSSSRPRLSQPSGDGRQTVGIFFHSAHFPILGELTKIGMTNVSTEQTISSIRWTFWGIFSSKNVFCVYHQQRKIVQVRDMFICVKNALKNHVANSGQNRVSLQKRRADATLLSCSRKKPGVHRLLRSCTGLRTKRQTKTKSDVGRETNQTRRHDAHKHGRHPL